MTKCIFKAGDKVKLKRAGFYNLTGVVTSIMKHPDQSGYLVNVQSDGINDQSLNGGKCQIMDYCLSKVG